MLQSVEYQPKPYLEWLWRVKDFRQVVYRKTLTKTGPARLLLWTMRAGIAAQYIAAIFLYIDSVNNKEWAGIAYAVGTFFIAPIMWAHLLIVPLIVGEWMIIRPRNALKIRKSSAIFAKHPGVKVAIAGSYGKTTMKEILLMVLSEGKKVKATPANRNVPISHAQFADGLAGNEEILIIEYGEGAPGDIRKFAKNTHPNVGVITGLAPAHLDRYKTLDAAGKDIFSLADYVDKNEVYVNGDSEAAALFIKDNFTIFGSTGINGWKVNNIKNDLGGLKFELHTPSSSMKLKTKLLGRHLIGPLVLAAYLGRRYGLTPAQIEKGISNIEPFEHRMKPYQLSGAWIIDDTYNGNIDGLKAGLALLKELPAKRKIYITPGLVDQGEDQHGIHMELGRAIKKAAPDQVVLMKHSVTDAIIEGMKGYKGQLIIETDPLDFYTNLDKFVAAGDLVLMQNDWPDNYN